MEFLHVSNNLTSVKMFRQPRIDFYSELGASVNIFTFDNWRRSSFSINSINTLFFKKYHVSEFYGILASILSIFVRSDFKILVLTGLGSPYIAGGSYRLIFRFLVGVISYFVDQVRVLNQADYEILSVWCGGKCRVLKQFGEMQTSDKAYIEARLPSFNRTGYKFVGRLVSHKGLAHLRDLAICLPDKSFDIFGEPDTKNPSYDKSAIDALQKLPNVKLRGFADHTALYVDNRRPLLILSFREGLSTVVLEAILSKTPVVGFAVPGVIDVFNEIHIHNPYLLDVSQYTRLSEKLSKNLDQLYDLEEASLRLRSFLLSERLRQKLDVGDLLNMSMDDEVG